MNKQVDKAHYDFQRYMDKRRWCSLWHQIDEVIKVAPDNVLEIGPGPGIFKAAMVALGWKVQTLDVDPDVAPDHVASVFSMPFRSNDFSVVCAFQMLEHLPFEQSIEAFCEMVRVAKEYIIISLPDSATRWPMSIYIPRLGDVRFSIPKPRFRAPSHKFDGEHYWEISKEGYSLQRILYSFCENAPVSLIRTYRVAENPYHRFLVFRKSY